MAKRVSALWRYGGYSSLSRSLFDAGSLADLDVSRESLNEPPSPSDSTRANASESDDESEDDALCAWAYNLSSDEDEYDDSRYMLGFLLSTQENEAQEEETQQEEEEEETYESGYFSDDENGYESEGIDPAC